MIFASSGLRLLGQPEELMANVEIYCRDLAFAIPFEVTYTIRQWLQNQHHVREALVAIVIANVLNILFNYLLIFTFDFGIVGCALATLLCQGLWPFGGPLLAVSPSVHLAGFPAPSLVSNQPDDPLFGAGLRPHCGRKLGLCGGQHHGGLAGATALAAHSIGLNIVSTSFMVVLGLSTAAATLVGNAVGAKRAWMPLVWRALSMMSGIQIPMAILLWCFPGFASIFTTDPAVIELFGDCASGGRPLQFAMGYRSCSLR